MLLQSTESSSSSSSLATTLTTTVSSTSTAMPTTLQPTSTVDTSKYPDYGDEAPINFMHVNYDFAVGIIIFQMLAAAAGTFGNILILVAVATHRMLRGVESVFVINLALYDLCITMFIQPLSVMGQYLLPFHFILFCGLSPFLQFCVVIVHYVYSVFTSFSINFVLWIITISSVLCCDSSLCLFSIYFFFI
jgi:hypothetical protein